MGVHEDERWDWDVPLDEAFVAGAARREESGERRAATAQRVAASHRSARPWRAPAVDGPARRTGRSRRDRRGLLAAAIAALIVGVWTVQGGLALQGRGVAALPGSDGTPVVPRPDDAQEGRVLPVVTAPPGEGGFVRLDEEAAFDPCRPVHWVMRPDGAPPGAQQAVQAAFDEVSQATGLAFVSDGTTDEAPDDRRQLVQERYGERYAPVLVAWSDEAESSGLAGGVAGYAGPYPADPDGRGRRFVSGQVVLDAPVLQAVASRPEEYGVVLHELGHLVGLDHVPDGTDTMAASGLPTADFTPGALRGLAAVGEGRCF